jgi:hypothetical protein
VVTVCGVKKPGAVNKPGVLHAVDLELKSNRMLII